MREIWELRKYVRVKSSKSSRDRRFWHASALLILVVFVFLFTQLSQLVYYWRFIPQHAVWRRPPPLGMVYRVDRAANLTTPDAGDWTHPRVLSTWAIPYDNSYRDLQLFVTTQGLFLRAHGWHLAVVGCLVGDDVFPRVNEFSGVYVCRVNRSIAEGERISVVVSQSPLVDAILSGSVTVKGVPQPYKAGDFSLLEKEIVRAVNESQGNLLQYNLLKVRSSVNWSSSFVDITRVNEADVESRYEVCLMTQEKTYPEDLEQWVDYHRRIGVDMVYIYDNEADVDLSAMFWNRSDVEVLYWPFRKSQVQAHNHFLSLARRRCEWALLIDVDEYVMLGKKGDFDDVPSVLLKRYLARKRESGYSAIYLREVLMGTSRLHYRPNDYLAEAYTFRFRRSRALGKSIIWTDGAKPDSFVHRVNLLRGHRRYLPRRLRYKRDGNLDLASSEACLIHFKTRSWEDFVRKGWNGRNSIMVADWNTSRDAHAWRVEAPPAGYLSLKNQTPFVQFRDYWRAVTATDQVRPPQHLVYSRGNTRCVAVIPVDSTADMAYPICARTRRKVPDATDYIMHARDFGDEDGR